MGHTGAADGFYESFLDDAVLNVQGQFAGTLLRSAPANAVRQAADVLYVLGFYPFAFFRNGSSTMVYFLGYACHVFHFL